MHFASLTGNTHLEDRVADILEFKPTRAEPIADKLLACDCGMSTLFIVFADKVRCPMCDEEYALPLEFEE